MLENKLTLALAMESGAVLYDEEEDIMAILHAQNEKIAQKKRLAKQKKKMRQCRGLRSDGKMRMVKDLKNTRDGLMERIEEVESVTLETLPSTEEIREAVWDCESSKAPGCDGYNMNFIKRCWNEIGYDFTTADYVDDNNNVDGFYGNFENPLRNDDELLDDEIFMDANLKNEEVSASEPNEGAHFGQLDESYKIDGTSSRCESLHSVIAKYVKSKYNLRDFVEHFDRCVAYICFKNSLADFECAYEVPVMQIHLLSLKKLVATLSADKYNRFKSMRDWAINTADEQKAHDIASAVASSGVISATNTEPRDLPFVEGLRIVPMIMHMRTMWDEEEDFIYDEDEGLDDAVNSSFESSIDQDI
ncbi:hypothetical protein AHAS_Ahas19G0074800 [Arachis hypogaea]